ncbi:MAG: type II toxin-antitoxin system VapC family toxin [Bacteroidales bacterium]|nr:type II toxin-antitoxin system VapC family toxin [Bacteroidales bacterium]
MVAFLDTSTLVKLYHYEVESEKLSRLISENVSEIFLSEIAKVEFVSAVWKKVRMKNLDEQIAKEVIKCFESDKMQFSWIKTDTGLIEMAQNLFSKYGLTTLRTLDALQLASCLSAKNRVDVFLTHDDFLNVLFQKEGLNTQFNS